MSVPDAPASLLGKGWTHLSSFDDLDDDEYEPEEVCVCPNAPFLRRLANQINYCAIGSIRNSGSWNYI